MQRRRLKHSRPIPVYRLRFEALETRYLLSLGGLANDCSFLFGHDIPAEGELPALVNAAIVNQSITTDAGVQQMPSVSVNPLDARHLVVSYMDRPAGVSGYAGLTAAISRDAGATWTRRAIPLPNGFDQGATYPIARFDDQGRLFLAYMAVTFLGPQPELTFPLRIDPERGVTQRTFGFQSNNGIFLVRSNDGGDTWSTPVAIDAFTYDGEHQVPFNLIPDLAIDTSRTLPSGSLNPHYGNLYATWSQYYAPGTYPGEPDSTGGSQVMFAVSKDGGETWETRRQENAETGGQVSVVRDDLGTGRGIPSGLGSARSSRLAIGPEGDIYVSIFDLGIFWVFHSSSAGQSFDVPDASSGRGLPFGVDRAATAEVPNAFPNARFRIQYPRSIAADPQRPGYVYITEAINHQSANGAVLDEADIWFSRSTDYGNTWEANFQVGENAHASVLNDDNGGNLAAATRDEVINGQALPQLVTGSDGSLTVIWYDSRRDPAGHLIDVFGTVSHDGGKSFSSNFRISDTSFDPDEGRFVDATDTVNYFLGDLLGLAVADGQAIAAWTDTRAGNQDVFWSRFSLTPPPAPAQDRFEPNDQAVVGSATELGSVILKYLPQLVVNAVDEDWFHFRTVADGTLTVATSVARTDRPLKLTLYDAGGSSVLATAMPIADTNGQITEYRIKHAVNAGEELLVQVTSDSPDPFMYDLELKALTSDLGSQVHGLVIGNLMPRGQAYYLLSVPASGSLRTLAYGNGSLSETLSVEFLAPDTLTLFNSESATDGTLRTAAGQQVLIHVFADPVASGTFTFAFTNLDQLTTPGTRELYFPAGLGPSQTTTADFNQDGRPDLAVSNAASDTVSVLLSNLDGTLQSPRQFAIGAFSITASGLALSLPNYRRDIAATDVNSDGLPDIVVLNYDSSDVSVLLGRGDGSFIPQRRSDAGSLPLALAVGDVNRDGNIDLVIAESVDRIIYSVLLGRGDGTFKPSVSAELTQVLPYDAVTIRLADVDGDQRMDLVVNPSVADHTFILIGNGNGTFNPISTTTRFGPGLAIADLDGDDKLDIIKADKLANTVSFALGNGDGTFADATPIDVGQSPLAVIAADVADPNIGTGFGHSDGYLDLIVVNSGLSQPVLIGPRGVMILAAQRNDDGSFLGFSDPELIYEGFVPQDVDVADIDLDGQLDVVVTDRDGIHVIYSQQPPILANNTFATARNLGTVVHLVQPTLTITPTQPEAWFRLEVPREAVPGSKKQVLDISGGFGSESGPGLQLEVFDVSGKLLASGARVRIQHAQGESLYIRVSGVIDASGVRGDGAYTLIYDVLPQVVAVEAQALLPGKEGRPGGPTASLVLVLQGDRLDPVTAENSSNYLVRWLGPDGIRGTKDDRVIPVGQGLPAGQITVVHDASSNIDVAGGRTFLTAVRQTVTLLFGEPLPAGSYEIEVSSLVQAAPFNTDEREYLSPRAGFTGHPVVSILGEQLVENSPIQSIGLVQAATALGDLSIFEQGTRFLTQLHNDLGALLDAQLTDRGDDPAITKQILDQIFARLDPALGPAADRLASLLVIFLDPVSIALVDPTGSSFRYNLETNAVVNALPRTFVEVGGNVEIVVIAEPRGTYQLDVANVSARARGGAIYLGRETVEVRSLTDALRTGSQSFSFVTETHAAPGPNLFRFLPPTLGQLATVTAPLVSPSLSSTLVREQLVGDSGRANTPVATSPVAMRLSPSFRSRGASEPAHESTGLMGKLWQELVEYWEGLRSRLSLGRRAPRQAAAKEVLTPGVLQSLLKLLQGTKRPDQSAAPPAPASSVPPDGAAVDASVPKILPEERQGAGAAKPELKEVSAASPATHERKQGARTPANLPPPEIRIEAPLHQASNVPAT